MQAGQPGGGTASVQSPWALVLSLEHNPKHYRTKINWQYCWLLLCPIASPFNTCTLQSIVRRLGGPSFCDLDARKAHDLSRHT